MTYDSIREIESSRAGFTYGQLPYHAFCTPDGELQPVSFTHHRLHAEHIVNLNKTWKEEFQKAHKNKGYDEIEFLIIVKGYIIISSGHFNFSVHGNTTSKQVRALGCDPRREKFKYDMYLSD